MAPFTPHDAPSFGGGVQVSARVRWFDTDKGFGFVTPDDGSPDAFIHISALNRAGLHELAAGTRLACRLVPGGRGPQVSHILEVLDTPAVPAPPRYHRPAAPAREVSGTVKWFKPDKGFGFAVADDGGQDVFLHKSMLRRCNVSHLGPGQRVLMHVQDAAKGREATWLILLG